MIKKLKYNPKKKIYEFNEELCQKRNAKIDIKNNH